MVVLSTFEVKWNWVHLVAKAAYVVKFHFDEIAFGDFLLSVSC